MNWLKWQKFALQNKFISKLEEDRTGFLPSLFGNSFRFTVPIESGLFEEIRISLEEKGYEVDFASKLAYKKNILKDGSEKWQPISLGKVIGRELGKNILDKYSNQYIESSEYSIVFSKAAIDVARMSDHMEIQSCHAPGGNFFHCALAEGNVGGAVAYVVKTKELQGIDINDEEIFEDEDRGVDGIRPISRLRLRRIVNKKTGEEIAIPENRIYGKKSISGFEDTVINVARDRQKELFEKYKGTPRSDFEIHGGSYQDTVSKDLLNSFFGDNADKKNIKIVGDENLADIWDQEIQEIISSYRNELNYFSIYTEIEESDDHPYIYCGISLLIPIREYLGLEFDIPNSIGSNWQQRRQIEKFIKNILNGCFDMYINEIEINDDEIRIDFNNENIDNPDDVKAKYEECIKEEEKIQEYMRCIREELLNLDLDFPYIKDLSGFKENIDFVNMFKFQNISISESEDHDFFKCQIKFPLLINQNKLTLNVENEIKNTVRGIFYPITTTNLQVEETLFGEEHYYSTRITQLFSEILNNPSGVIYSWAVGTFYINKHLDQKSLNWINSALAKIDEQYSYFKGIIDNICHKAQESIKEVQAKFNWYRTIMSSGFYKVKTDEDFNKFQEIPQLAYAVNPENLTIYISRSGHGYIVRDKGMESWWQGGWIFPKQNKITFYCGYLGEVEDKRGVQDAIENYFKVYFRNAK